MIGKIMLLLAGLLFIFGFVYVIIDSIIKKYYPVVFLGLFILLALIGSFLASIGV